MQSGSLNFYPHKVPLDEVVDRLVLAGGVSEVVNRVLRLHELTGSFGEMVYAGLNWAEPALARSSMELMATAGINEVNRALAKSV